MLMRQNENNDVSKDPPIEVRYLTILGLLHVFNIKFSYLALSYEGDPGCAVAHNLRTI